ncbi:MAG: hypothetical protein AB1529_04100 [Candidatus Micrarchaeota archaeon]
MNKPIVALLVILSLSAATHVFTVDVDRSGLSSVTVSMQGGENVSVALPSDASDIRIVGGSYRLSNGSASIVPGQSGFTTFSFTTSLFTSKTDSSWRLSFSPPDGASVRVFMPSYASIQNSFPQPDSVSSLNSRTELSFGFSKLLTVYYKLDEVPQATDEGIPQIYLIGAALLIAAVIAAIALRGGTKTVFVSAPPIQPAPPASAPQEKQPTLDLTAGKKEMMETFNENDTKIVNYLLSSEGKSRRNELERKTSISKSSLAMAINRLEKRKIIEIDRTSTTHFVKLSDYFMRL